MMIPEIKAIINRWKNGVNLTADIPTAIAEKVVVVEEHEVLEVIGQDMSEEVAFVHHQKKLEILARIWEAKKALHLEDEVAEEDLEVASEEAFLEVVVVSVAEEEAIVHEEAVLLIPEVEDVVVLVEEDVVVEDPTWE